MNHLRQQSYKNERTEMKYLSNIWKDRILKIKNSFLELEKNLKELKDRELKAREIKIGKEKEEQFFKLINVSIDDIDKFEKKKMK